MIGSSIGVFKFFGGAGSPYLPETLALIAQMSPAPNTAQTQKIDTFIRGCIADGNWDEIDIMYLFHAPYQQWAPLNWRLSSFTATEIEIVSPIFAANSGYSPNASNYLNTNWNPSTQGVKYTQNSGSMAVYLENNVQDNSGFPFGHHDGTRFTYLRPRDLVDKLQIVINSGTATGTTNNADSSGLISITRNNSTQHIAARNGIPFATLSATSNGIPNNNVFIMCANNNGTPSVRHPNRYRAYCAGSGNINQALMHARIVNYLT
jgi:hypothetical protein